ALMSTTLFITHPPLQAVLLCLGYYLLISLIMSGLILMHPQMPLSKDQKFVPPFFSTLIFGFGFAFLAVFLYGVVFMLSRFFGLLGVMMSFAVLFGLYAANIGIEHLAGKRLAKAPFSY